MNMENAVLSGTEVTAGTHELREKAEAAAEIFEGWESREKSPPRNIAHAAIRIILSPVHTT